MSMATVKGIGWIANGECGCIAKDERFGLDGAFEGPAPSGIFSHPFKNFGRLDKASRMTALAVALALRDAGIPYAPERKQDVGIIGASREGSLRTDLLYFKDYVDCGRTLARGNLFIYTLPSSPLGEAAIHFGLQGPLLYQTAAAAPLATVIETAEDIIIAGEAERMLAGLVDDEAALYLTLTSEGGRGVCDARQARDIAGTDLAVFALIEEFRARKGTNSGS